MSLSALALRNVTVRALTGATWAGARVHDSEAAPINQTAAEARGPFILVFTDDESIEVQGKALFAGDETRKLKLVIELAVSDVAKVEGDEALVAVIPSADAGREMTLDVIRRQACAALVGPSSASPWGELWRKIVTKIDKIEVIRGADVQKGVRFAAKQVAFTLDTITEPAPGEKLEYVWKEIVEAFEADSELTNIGGIMRALIETPADVPPWLVAQAQLGLTAEGLASIGLAPIVVDEDGEAISLDTAEIEAQADPALVLSSEEPNAYDPPASA